MHHVSVGQALGKAVPTDLTRSRGGRNWDSGGGHPIPDWARRRMLDFLALFFGSGKIRAGRGYFGSRSSARYQGQSHQPRHPPRWHRFARRRAFLFGLHCRFERPFRRFPLRFPLFFLQSRQVSAGWPATGQETSALAGVHRTVECSSPKRRKEHCWQHGLRPWFVAETALHSDARESSGSWCRPVPECLVVARISQHHRRTRRRASNSQHLLFLSSSLEGAMFGRSSPGLETFEKRCSCKVPHVPPFAKAATRAVASYPPQLCVEKADLWLDSMTSRDAKFNVLDSSAYKGQHGSKVLRSNASVCLQPKSKREDKEAENEPHVGGLRRPSQTSYLVPGWASTGRRIWDCIDTALGNNTDASGLTRLYGQADFQGPPPELAEKVRRAIRK